LYLAYLVSWNKIIKILSLNLFGEKLQFFNTLISFIKVKRSFLVTMGINENPVASKLITEEFFEGITNLSKKRTTEELSILSKIEQKLSTLNENKPFVFFASQACPDLLLHVGK
jgi:hypothetical protein